MKYKIIQTTQKAFIRVTFSSKLDWGSYIISIAQISSKKIGASIRSMKCLSPKVALVYCLLTCDCINDYLLLFLVVWFMRHFALKRPFFISTTHNFGGEIVNPFFCWVLCKHGNMPILMKETIIFSYFAVILL